MANAYASSTDHDSRPTAQQSDSAMVMIEQILSTTQGLHERLDRLENQLDPVLAEKMSKDAPLEPAEYPGETAMLRELARVQGSLDYYHHRADNLQSRLHV